MNPTGTLPEALGPMTRRQAVARIALLMGGALVGSRALLSGQAVQGKETPAFTDADRALLDEIGDTIIPPTDIPGAKAVGIGAFAAMMVADCYDPAHHAAFREGLAAVNEAAARRYGRDFTACSPEERTELLNAIDAEQRVHGEPAAGTPPHYFRMMKELTVLGFFSSEVGCTRAIRYLEVPGSFNGSYPYKKGDKAWFS
jgi:hypothetical protein